MTIIQLHYLVTIRVKVQGWQQCIPVNVLVMEAVLIAKDMGVLLACNLPQSQDTNTQTDASKSRVVLAISPSLDLPERRLETRDQQAIPLMLGNSSSGWATREMGTMFTMGGASYLPWLVGSLEEHPGEGYWLSFNQRLPISYKLGDRLYGLLHHGWLVRDEEDVEGEIAENAVACSDSLYINLRKFWQLKSVSGNTMWPMRNNYLKRK